MLFLSESRSCSYAFFLSPSHMLQQSHIILCNVWKKIWAVTCTCFSITNTSSTLECHVPSENVFYKNQHVFCNFSPRKPCYPNTNLIVLDPCETNIPILEIRITNNIYYIHTLTLNCKVVTWSHHLRSAADLRKVCNRT